MSLFVYIFSHVDNINLMDIISSYVNRLKYLIYKLRYSMLNLLYFILNWILIYLKNKRVRLNSTPLQMHVGPFKRLHTRHMTRK